MQFYSHSCGNSGFLASFVKKTILLPHWTVLVPSLDSIDHKYMGNGACFTQPMFTLLYQPPASDSVLGSGL